MRIASYYKQFEVTELPVLLEIVLLLEKGEEKLQR